MILTRKDKDLLGVLPVSGAAYHGLQTQQALENFRLSGVPLRV